MKEKTLYEILEVSENASNEIIEKAYKVLVKKYHPDLQQGADKTKAEEMMKKLNEAYEVLSDEEKRSRYDLELEEKRQEELERLILIEKNKQTVLLTEAQIREYYEEALRSEPQLLINYLIQKIVWYDDRIEIFFTNPIHSPIYIGPDTDRGFLFCKVFL